MIQSMVSEKHHALIFSSRSPSHLHFPSIPLLLLPLLDLGHVLLFFLCSCTGSFLYALDFSLLCTSFVDFSLIAMIPRSPTSARFTLSVTLALVFLAVIAECSSPNLRLAPRFNSDNGQQILNQPSDHVEPSQPSLAESGNRVSTLSEMVDALDVMQEDYFALWQGIWPDSIDWTAAVLGTYLSGALTTLSKSLSYITNGPRTSKAIEHENLVNRYFSQLTGAYFGQDAFSLRTQAYDDMLWVVLGWIESIKFVQLHSAIHYERSKHSSTDEETHPEWYGVQWIPSFAHRARLFWDLASQGWDTKLCDGGMIWSPYLAPYKNAITNQLYIAASISMYLYFPGDSNTSPFNTKDGLQQPGKPHDPRYLAAAVDGYKWLTTSNMTDSKGLYVDGFHISQARREENQSLVNTRCDERNEMVYTYNQGVLLSGQRGLWEATGAQSYLDDGHKLIEDVIRATGYDLKRDDVLPESGSGLAKWHGLGRAGILEEVCDAQGYCSQNGQTFKGIFFHHLTLFCASLPPHLVEPGVEFDQRAFENVKAWHEKSCAAYGGWIKHNAIAAVGTKNQEGKFGMWWGAPKDHRSAKTAGQLPDGAVDYKNLGVPRDGVWQNGIESSMSRREEMHMSGVMTNDANDRGRGRTVETQGGGVAVLRALWEIVDLRALER
jgi:hypothetical protein